MIILQVIIFELSDNKFDVKFDVKSDNKFEFMSDIFKKIL